MTEVNSNKKKQKSPEKEMSFWEHLEELRWHIVRSVIAIFIFAIIAFLNRKLIFDVVILAPKDSNFITNRILCQIADYLSISGLCIGEMSLKIINISMSGQFMTHMYISMIVGLVAAFPYVIYEIWSFINPALHSKEKKYSGGAVISSSLLFMLGVLFSYFIIVPLTVNFFGTYQVSDAVENSISLDSYISTVVSVTFAVGLVFELPIFVYFLTKIGIITPSFMKKNRKYMLVILLIIAAIITPPDVFSQILVVIPLYGLYELSISLSKRVYKKRVIEMED
ncbi:MAG: twin-arginine translocase subunit TatC [Bacteroidetes bacterium HGW-Bacteroidetes-17]|jgi:sec-independent protein translocase protein TatC|nr:MAG: twin-arginine translocase subunit TatC [Bacteroidetes bacterium HGW-Bacteroidetes-17]